MWTMGTPLSFEMNIFKTFLHMCDLPKDSTICTFSGSVKQEVLGLSHQHRL